MHNTESLFLTLIAGAIPPSRKFRRRLCVRALASKAKAKGRAKRSYLTYINVLHIALTVQTAYGSKALDCLPLFNHLRYPAALYRRQLTTSLWPSETAVHRSKQLCFYSSCWRGLLWAWGAMSRFSWRDCSGLMTGLLSLLLYDGTASCTGITDCEIGLLHYFMCRYLHRCKIRHWTTYRRYLKGWLCNRHDGKT